MRAAVIPRPIASRARDAADRCREDQPSAGDCSSWASWRGLTLGRRTIDPRAAQDRPTHHLRGRPHVVDDQQHPPTRQRPPQHRPGGLRVGHLRRGRVEQPSRRYQLGRQVQGARVLPDGHPHHPAGELGPHPRVVRHHPRQRRLPEPARPHQTGRHPHRGRVRRQHRRHQRLRQLRARHLIPPQRRHRPHRPRGRLPRRRRRARGAPPARAAPRPPARRESSPTPPSPRCR